MKGDKKDKGERSKEKGLKAESSRLKVERNFNKQLKTSNRHSEAERRGGLERKGKSRERVDKKGNLFFSKLPGNSYYLIGKPVSYIP